MFTYLFILARPVGLVKPRKTANRIPGKNVLTLVLITFD